MLEAVFTAKMSNCPNVEKTLKSKKGSFLHAFRSGGGLRVLRLETKTHKLLAYGEHPTVDVALIHLEEDHVAGGRKYEKVYGPIYTHYLTGTQEPSNQIDLWLLRGISFDIKFEDHQFVFTTNFTPKFHCPQEIQDLTWKNGDVPLRYRSGEAEYEATPCQFADESRGVSLKTIKSAPGTGKYGNIDGKVVADTLDALWEKLEIELPQMYEPKLTYEVLQSDGTWSKLEVA